MDRYRRAGQRRKAAALTIAAVTCIGLACTCGPINTVLGLRATAESAQGTLGAFATELDENMPTLEAGLTEMAPTLNAQLTELAVTMEAVSTP